MSARKLLTRRRARSASARSGMQDEAERDRIDPYLADKLRQIVKVTGKEKVLAFVRSL